MHIELNLTDMLATLALLHVNAISGHPFKSVILFMGGVI